MRTTNSKSDYFQQVRASGRAFGFLGLLLGATAGALTGVAVKGLIGDPVVSGSGAVAFYAAFGGSSLITLYVMFNYVMMNLRVTAGNFEVRIGMKSASIAIADVEAVRVAETKSRMTRVASQAQTGSRKISKMWSVLGVGSGIEIDIAGKNGGPAQTWFVSSNDPEALCEKLASVISSSDDDAPVSHSDS